MAARLLTTGRLYQQRQYGLTDAALTHTDGTFDNYNCAGLTITAAVSIPRAR
jgi:hypothetical protein